MNLEAKHRETIEAILLGKIRDMFGNVKILKTEISRIEENEDGIVVDVEIIFSGKSKDIDPRLISGAFRNIRPDIEEQFGDDAFPLLSFIANSELGKRKLEAH